MAQHVIAIGRMCVTGSHRQEVANWLLKIEEAARKHPEISHLVHLPISRVPTPVARNCLVPAARKHGATLLFMVDEDMWPADDFFEQAVNFLLRHEGPAVIGSPYCTAPPEEQVNVMEWGAPKNGRQRSMQLVSVTREDACRRTGIEQVANLGTGCVAYDMHCFDKISHPYFDYAYTDETHTEVCETEDCFNFKKIHFAGIPLYIHWDCWAAHRKDGWIGKPTPVSDKQVNHVFLEHARAEVRHGGRELAALIPDGFDEAPPDFAPLYEQAAREIPERGHLVEVGSWLGQSAILMARLIARSKRNLKFTCVDHFLGTPNETQSHLAGSDKNYYAHVVAQHGGCVRAAFDANLERCGVADRVNVIHLPSVDAAKAFPDQSLDFVFLDAAHDYESVGADIEAWLPKIKNGGVIAGHDIGWSGVMRAVGEILGNVTIMGTSWVCKVNRRPDAQVPVNAQGDTTLLDKMMGRNGFKEEITNGDGKREEVTAGS
jgi:predicted O-methyltransferase YrrM